MRYRKKPLVIEAYRVSYDEVPNWMREREGVTVSINGENFSMQIPTLEGIMTVQKGDWIIKGIKDEIYSCKPDIFEESYEKVDE